MTTIYPGDGDPRHGTDNGYNNLGCRCVPCTGAHATACYEQVHKWRPPLKPNDPRHGTSTGYRYWWCDCRKCLDKLCEDSNRSRRRRQAQKKEKAA